MKIKKMEATQPQCPSIDDKEDVITYIYIYIYIRIIKKNEILSFVTT